MKSVEKGNKTFEEMNGVLGGWINSAEERVGRRR